MVSINKAPTLLASSSNPQELSALVQGVLMAIAPIVIQIMKSQGVDIAQNDATNIIQAITGSVSIAVMLFGSIRKLYNMVKGLLK